MKDVLTYSDDKNKRNNILIYIFLLIYGFVVAYWIFGFSDLVRHTYVDKLEDCYMWLRVDWLNELIAGVSETGVYTGLHRLYNHNASVFMYLSHIGAWFGLDAVQTFYVTQFGFIVLCTGLYPALTYRCFNNLPISILSVLFFKMFMPHAIYSLNDCYFIAGWIVYITAPVLYMLYSEKFDIKKIKWLFFLIIVVAIGNVFRSNASLCIIAQIVVLMTIKVVSPAIKNKNSKAIIFTIGIYILTFIAQSFFTTTVPKVYQKITNQPEPLPIMGPWHTLYIGLGWQENPSGLYYMDECGYEGRWDLLYDTSDGYYMGIESPDYLEQIKADYFKELYENWNFHISSYIKKAFTALITPIKSSIISIPVLIYRRTIPHSPFSLLVLMTLVLTPVVLLYRWKKDKKKLFRYLCIWASMLFINYCVGILPGIVSYPYSAAQLYVSVASLDLLLFVDYILVIYTVFDIFENIITKNYSSNKTRQIITNS